MAWSFFLGLYDDQNSTHIKDIHKCTAIFFGEGMMRIEALKGLAGMVGMIASRGDFGFRWNFDYSRH